MNTAYLIGIQIVKWTDATLEAECRGVIQCVILVGEGRVECVIQDLNL